MLELTTVADDEVVFHRVGAGAVVHGGLAPGTEYELEGVTVHTLDRPPGERLATFATVNDVHFGEVECGLIVGMELGPVLRSEPGEPPYPETMNRAAVAEIAAIDPVAVVAKGDLTSHGTAAEFQEFLDCYGAAFGDRLHYVRGNHDAAHGETFAATPCQEVALPGATLAILDTARPGMASGRVTPEQIEWLDELAARADRPVVVIGHHHPWSPDSRSREETYFGVNPDDSDALVAVAARRRAIVAYLAGHTHRNRVRHFSATGTMPWVEVACTKDYPGAWAEYRVFEGGVLQIMRRISGPEALAWTDRTREMFAGHYAAYSFGRVEDRCFAVMPRAG